MFIDRLCEFLYRSKQDHLNNKYPKCVIVLPLGFMPKYGFYDIDIRAFFVNPVLHELREIVNNLAPYELFSGKWCDDQVALQCLLWVIDHIKYVSDKSQFGVPEYWCTPSETLHTRKGDCDDGAILLANLMLVAGIPYWKIRLTAGMVHTGEGHAYVTYFCEALGYWVALDWCYYPNRKSVAERPDYKVSKIYGEVWFSWNQKYAFMKGVKETGKVARIAKSEPLSQRTSPTRRRPE